MRFPLTVNPRDENRWIPFPAAVWEAACPSTTLPDSTQSDERAA